MHFLFALVLSLVTLPAFAKDLPSGSYYVAGNVLPAIQDGAIVPVQVHLTISGNRLDWRFITSFVPDAMMCDTYGKCAQTVQTLTHEVTWAEDGTLVLHDTHQKTGPGLLVDRAELDTLMIHAPITALIDGAKLSFNETGGTLSNTALGPASRNVTLVPATLDQVLNAMTVPMAFELSLARLDQCAIRQVLSFYNAPDPSPAQADLLQAILYFRFLGDLHAEASYYAQSEPPAEDAERLKALRLKSFAASLAFSWPARDAASAYNAGTPLTDLELMTLARQGVATLRGSLAEDYSAVATDILVDRQDSLLAAMRLSTRYAALVEAGRDPYDAVCTDVTLGG